ncbi:MAG: hypothetical protein JXR16_13675 [Bermanella sp.]
MSSVKIIFLLLIFSVNANAVELEQLAKPITQLKAIAEQPAIQLSVQAHSHDPLDIQGMIKIDQQWKVNPNLPNELLDPRVQQLFIKYLSQPHPMFVELILMGKQGQTLAGAPHTTDYWQGDEAKFIETLKRENVYVSSLDWDESSRTISAQISIPVWINGNIQGVLTGAVEANLEALSNTEVDPY